jgi:hypothetical protein
VENLLVLLAGLVFVVSIVWLVEARQRAEAHYRAQQRQEWAKLHRQQSHRRAHGSIVARLAEASPGYIVVGGRAMSLRDGETCAPPVGTLVRVVYTVVDGRRLVDGIMPVQAD